MRSLRQIMQSCPTLQRIAKTYATLNPSSFAVTPLSPANPQTLPVAMTPTRREALVYDLVSMTYSDNRSTLGQLKTALRAFSSARCGHGLSVDESGVTARSLPIV